MTNSSSSPAPGENLSAYDVLRSYNFPVGLLPEGAASYALDPTTGKFFAYFNRTCSFSIQSAFSVGMASADFTIDNFYVCPQCDCGLSCAAISSRLEERFQKKLNRLVIEAGDFVFNSNWRKPAEEGVREEDELKIRNCINFLNRSLQSLTIYKA
ncbi:hypothetical protein KSP39_PZI006383 [Platanthera zijinensis]|uniref:Uncharacterized protein n=1 Tax=Platanthera zijinensis TaxID=2320716 RepID=A0AAP0BPH4_9ASPA